VLPVRYEHYLHIQSRAIPVTGRRGPYGFVKLRIPHCVDSRLSGGGEVSRFTDVKQECQPPDSNVRHPMLCTRSDISLHFPQCVHTI
jgi:hypothetical protein